MIFVLYFVVGSHFGFPRLVFVVHLEPLSWMDLVFCRPLFSTKSPVSTFSRNDQGFIYIYIYIYIFSFIYIYMDGWDR